MKHLLVTIVFLSLFSLIYPQTNPLYLPVDSLFRTETPTTSSNDMLYELGSEFQTLANGFITKARLFSHVNEGGNHTVRLWMYNGSAYTLVAGPFTWNFLSGVSGWREYTFADPIAVVANTNYIISITNGPDRNYVKYQSFVSTTVGSYIDYINGTYNTILGNAPTNNVLTCYFRDVVFALPSANGDLNAGTIGSAQSLCYNTTPSPLVQMTPPSGGTGTYTYQWQSSADNSVWTNITNANLPDYSPPALSGSTYFRRTVTSGSYVPVSSSPVLITVSNTTAQLHDNISIFTNTSTFFNITVSGGVPPYTINYTRNNISQSTIYNYLSGTNISTGVLTNGIYSYVLTSVTDANGCAAQSLGSNITITVTENSGYLYFPVDSLFRTETPTSFSNDRLYELGTEFRTLSDGFITKARLFSQVNEGGNHVIRLWELNGSSYILIAGPYTWSFSTGVSGWRNYTLPSPVAVDANTTYIISITNSSDLNYSRTQSFQSSTVGSYVTYTRGVYGTVPGETPTSSYLSSCYFRDVVFSIFNANGNLSAGSIGSPQSICYNSAPVALTQVTPPSGGTGTYTYQWQSSADNSIWSNIPGANLQDYAPLVLSSSTYFRRAVTSGTYLPVYTTPVLITVYSNLTPGSIGNAQSVCYNSAPAQLTQINAPSGGTGTYTYQWQSSPDNSTWSDIPGGTSTGYNPPALTSNTYYRRNITSGSCGTVNSNSILITVYATLTPGSVGTAQTICYNTAPASFTQLTAPTGGTGTYTYRWQTSTDNTNWSDIPGATAANYSPSALTSNTYYRRNVTSGTCGTVISNSILITVYATLTPGTVGTAQTICYNTAPAALTQLTAPTGGTGTYTYQWQSSPDNNTWSNITGASSAGYNPPALLLNTYYRRNVTSGTCGTVNSASILITVSPQFTLAQLHDNTSIGNNTSTNFNIAITGGTSPFTINYARNGISQTTINNYTSGANISTGVLTTGVYIYSLTSVTDAIGCAPQNLGTNITVTVSENGNLTPGSIGSAQSLCYNTAPSPLTQLTAPTGGTGTYTYQWQSSPDNSLWTNISGATLSDYAPPALSSSTYFRRTVSSGSYNPVYSNSLLITVYAILTPGSIGTAQTICYNSAPAALTQLTAPAGGTGSFTYQWQSSPNNNTWSNITGALSAGYNPPTLLSNTYYRRNVTSGTCGTVNSTSLLITVSPQITLAQLHDNISIGNNTSTNFNITITGGTSPFTVNYTRNGVPQSIINNYASGNNISTGILTTGVYVYSLTSVTDATGCVAQNLGSNITVTVTESSGSLYLPVDSLFRTETPTTSSNDMLYELGSEFHTLANGFITKARLFSHVNEGGNHTVRLWMFNGTAYTLVAGPFTWNFLSGVSGWREYTFADPIAVVANTNYIISITNGPDRNYVKYQSFVSTTVGSYINYINGTYNTILGNAPTNNVLTCYFRDVVFALPSANGDLNAGTIGSAQSLCYNTTPSPLVQLTPPSGGTGAYTYQWQSSADNSVWTNIANANLPDYSPPALSASTYFRRSVTSGSYVPVSSSPVLITVSNTTAQLHDNITIFNNSSTNFNVAISGGISPYTVSYTRNGVSQSVINNYTSGNNISTGILTMGVYTYALTSVTDANGCAAGNLGTTIGIIVSENSASLYTPVDSLFRTEIPSSSSNDRLYELGSEFQTLSDGYITKARLFSHINEGGDHFIRLWSYNGSAYTLIGGPFTWNFQSGVSGWREYTFATPIPVAANNIYIISITNGPDFNYSRAQSFQSATVGSYIQYVRGVYSTVLGTAPTNNGLSCYFRDVVFSIIAANGNLDPGTIGSDQTLCYNTLPAPLTQINAPSGGNGVYTYQWQSSPDNSIWTDIPGATLSGYSPPALLTSTYFRRTVISGSFSPVRSNSVLMAVSNAIAQLQYNITIYNNSSTYLYINISEGASPYIINYTRNGIPQSTINNYLSGTGISTGVLTTGSYTYSLTSVTDANGCSAQNLGSNITVTVTENPGVVINSNKALVLVNSSSVYYPDYVYYIKPYLDNFGIPYDIINVSTDVLPVFNGYAIIIFGHRDVYVTGYPITQLEASISNGVGLYSFDPHLFDFTSGFSSLISQRSVNSNQINIPVTTHFITQYHAPDIYSPTNNTINLLDYWSLSQTSSLNNGVDLVTMNSGGQTISLLQVSNYGNGRIVKWSGYHWIHDNILGPIAGMDDLLWRGIVWAARKPFVIQGLPPMITMRVDDVSGAGNSQLNNFRWARIANDFGFIPWIGTFNNDIPLNSIPILRNLINNNLATASPHSFSNDQFIYFNNENLPLFDAAENVRDARDFFIQNGLSISSYMVPHTYGLSSQALSEVRAMGIEFIGIQMLPDNFYFGGTPWINCEPYRINRNGIAASARPVYYGGFVNLNGIEFFNCVTEIRDDGGYEWYPNEDVGFTSARGIRHLRRSLNSMVLSALFTHEYYLDRVDTTAWRGILQQITTQISGYNPEYTSTDYAVQYIRAKKNIRITNVRETLTNIEITYTGNNDMDTKCYLFTEQSGQITYRYVGLPQINGSHIVSIIK